MIELVEHPGILSRWDATFFVEIVFIESLFIATGITAGWIIKLISEKNYTNQLLEAKSNLSQQLSSAQDWDEITSLIASYPRVILPLRSTLLLSFSPQKERFEMIASWPADLDLAVDSPAISMESKCLQCIFDNPFVLRPVASSCSPPEIQLNSGYPYCFPLSYGDSTRAMLQVLIEPGKQPTSQQTEMLNKLGPIMAIALRAAHENRIRERLAAENAAQSVRQTIARDMHDMLAQNLAYLQIKLDQLAKLDYQEPGNDLRDNLLKLHEVAGESYELIRNTLVDLHPSNRLRLAEILSEQANTFAERAGLDIRFTQQGQKQPLDPMLIHQVHQLYRETLNNIEKHSGAERVETSLQWMDEHLLLTVKDDGCGFDPKTPIEGDHFGLAFMRERLDEIQGDLHIESNPGCGAIISMSIPISSNHLDPAETGSR
jgi:signal transduction histidine kinase